MQKLISISLALLFCLLLQAQTPVLDSLKQKINAHPQRDTARVQLIMDYVVAAVNENTTQLLPYLSELINISKEQHFNKGIQSAYITAQIYYSDRGDFSNSILYADSAFLYLKGDTTLHAIINVAYLHNNLGGDYMKLGDYEQAIMHYSQAADLLEKYKPQVVAGVYSGLAEVYERLQQFEKAFAYDRKAIAAAEKSGNKTSVARRYINYAGRYINQHKTDSAQAILKKVEPIVMELQQSFLYVFYYQNLGYVMQAKQKLNEAIASYKKAYGYALAADDKYQQQSVMDPLAGCLIEAGRLEEAKPVIDSLLQHSISYSMPATKLHAYSLLADWYMAKGDYKTASDFLRKKVTLSDSISSDEMKEKVALMETRFHMQQKDKEITNLQTEKEIQQLSLQKKSIINNISLGSIAVLLLLSLMAYRNYMHRQKIQQQRINELETEKQLSATEAVLKGEEQERTRLARDLHDGLGGMLSGIKYTLNDMKGNLVMTPENAMAFERGIDMLDSSIREMRRVAHNMMPEALVKFGLDTALRDVCNDISHSSSLQVQYQSLGMENVAIDQTKSVTLYRIVQELLNNIIKHAAATTALVQIAHNSGQVSITVEDNGKGFDTALLSQSQGAGWNNIKNRVEFLKGSLDLQSKPGNGTSVHIETAV